MIVQIAVSAFLSVVLAVVYRWSLVTTVVISGTPSHNIPPLLYGLMFEDINHSGDGGLYGELLQNRAFQHVTPATNDALYAWESLNGALLTVVADPLPVSSALPNSLRVTSPPSGTENEVGFSNSGYWGIKVNSSWTYDASFSYRFPKQASFKGKLQVSLRSSTGEILASESVRISGWQTTWEQVDVVLRPTKSAADTNNTFVVSFDGSKIPGVSIHFAMFSLFPPTYNDRPNGMRVDIAEALVEMAPTFFRFPGGNNLEGQTVPTRWQWNATVGHLLDRPGRPGDWEYVNTDGLGLMEYLTFIEDAGMEPIMGVWSGYALGGTHLTEEELAPYIWQAIDQIDFVIGDPIESEAAALRAELGHPEPFHLKYVEIGNEDFFAASTYPYRWKQFVEALKDEFPRLEFIATTEPWSPLLSPTPAHYDVHVYHTPRWFSDNAFYYDDFERNGTTYFEGEYAVISTNASDLFGTPETGRLLFPTMEGAVGEAAFMTGLERNSDIVIASCYAPLLQHLKTTQWTPDLISFDANQVIKSTSYYVQKLFSLNKGDVYLPSTLPKRGGTLHWSVTQSNSTRTVMIKASPSLYRLHYEPTISSPPYWIANIASSRAAMKFELPFENVGSIGTLVQLRGTAGASNTPESPDTIAPVVSSIDTGKELKFSAPAHSVSIISVNIQ